VVSVDAKTSDAFARILLQPTAGIARHRQLLVLLADAKQMTPPPPPLEAPIQTDARTHKPSECDRSESRAELNLPHLLLKRIIS